jgi:hypothetical protein
MILFKVLTKKFVKDGNSEFQNFRVNFCTFHAPFSTRLSQIGQAITSFAQDGFNNNEELMEGVKTWLSSMAADFFDTGIQKLIPQYDKCLNSGRDYIEKQLKYVLIFCIQYNFFLIACFLTAHQRLLLNSPHILAFTSEFVYKHYF